MAKEANRYLDEKSPWKTIKHDREAAATSLYVAICVISSLKTVLYPFLPFSSQRVHEYLGFDGNVQADGWRLRRPEPGRPLPKPKALFTKLEESVVQEESSKLGQPYQPK